MLVYITINEEQTQITTNNKVNEDKATINIHAYFDNLTLSKNVLFAKY